MALALQVFVVHGPHSLNGTIPRVILVGSYLLLFVFVLANWRRPGIAVIGVGLFLNFLAIASNGGLMPMSPETLRRAFPGEEAQLDGWVPDSKDVLLTREDTRLWPLTDVIVWRNDTGVNAFSPGDLIIGAGLVVTLGELLLPRVQRVSRDRASLT